MYPSNSSIVTASGKHIRIVAEFCANPAPTRVIWVTETSVLRPGQRRERLIAHDLTVSISVFLFYDYTPLQFFVSAMWSSIEHGAV